MISIQAQIDKPSERWLRRMQKETPKAYERAVVLALRSARSQLSKTIRKGGGTNGVPSFIKKDEMTVELHGRGSWFGSLNSTKLLRAWRSGDIQHLGWIDDVQSFVGDLQEPASFMFDKGTRRSLHKKGIRDVPAYYSRPARYVIDPYRDYLENTGTLADWISSIARKIVSGKLGGRGTIRSSSRRSRGGMSYARAQGRE